MVYNFDMMAERLYQAYTGHVRATAEYYGQKRPPLFKDLSDHERKKWRSVALEALSMCGVFDAAAVVKRLTAP